MMAQLFFTLLLVAVYTGNINSFLLNVPTVTKVRARCCRPKAAVDRGLTLAREFPSRLLGSTT